MPDPSFALIERARAILPSRVAELGVSRQMLAASGVLVGRLRLGERDRARDLMDHFLAAAPAVEDHTSAFDRSLFWSAVSEVTATTRGAARDAGVYAHRALLAATAAEDARAGYRAAALVCGATGVNGEYAAAEAARTLARSLAEDHGWAPGFASYGLYVGELFIASADMDVAALTTLAALLRERPSDLRASSTAVLADGMIALAQGDPSRAISHAQQIVSGTADERVLPIVRGFALGIAADAHLLRGEPRRALTLLEGVPSNVEHTLCFDMQRASAHLALADPVSALRVTSGCLALGTRHCARTRGPILLRRALAHRSLGDHDLAEAAFEDAVATVVASGSAVAMLTLSKDDLTHFVAGFRAKKPEAAAALDSFLRQLSRVPDMLPGRGPRVPELTRREQDVAWRLRSPLTVSEMAQQSFVSANTVKSQLRSLYAKLGVSSRSDAVDVLERAGFYDRVPPGGWWFREI